MNDEDVDKNATTESFMLVAGVSTITFGLSTDLPFLVAPSVLYVARETGYVRLVLQNVELVVRTPGSTSFLLSGGKYVL